MNKLHLIKPERRRARRGPSFASSRDYQRHAESEISFHVIRATATAPGAKTWREKKLRSGARVAFRTEAEAFRALLGRAAEQGDVVIVERAVDEVWDAVVEFTRLVSRMVTDAREQAAARLASQAETTDTPRAA